MKEIPSEEPHSAAPQEEESSSSSDSDAEAPAKEEAKRPHHHHGHGHCHGRGHGGPGRCHERRHFFKKKVREFIDEIAPQVFQTLAEGGVVGEPEGPATHKNYVCDICEMEPIVGVRYKCAVCENFDLCENCEAKDLHDHPLVKIRKPEHAPKYISAEVHEEQPQHQHQQWEENHGGWGGHHPHHGGPPQWGMWGRGARGGERGGAWNRGGRGGCSWGRGAGFRPEQFRPFFKNMAETFGPLVKEFMAKGGWNKEHGHEQGQHEHGHEHPHNHHHGKLIGGEWDAHSKYPRMMVPLTKKEKIFCAPGQMIIQTLKVENRSPLPWPPAVWLKPLFTGDVKIDSQISVPGPLEPGASGDIVIPLQAPMKPGKYKVVFGLFAPNGERLGMRLVIKMIVMDEGADVEQKQKAELMKKAAELAKDGTNFWKAYHALKDAAGDMAAAKAKLQEE